MSRLSLVFVVMAALSLTACNTVRGIGQDVEKGGEAIQKAVK